MVKIEYTLSDAQIVILLKATLASKYEIREAWCQIAKEMGFDVDTVEFMFKSNPYSIKAVPVGDNKLIALKKLLDDIKGLADSGDAGNINVDNWSSVKLAKEVLANAKDKDVPG